MKSSIENVNMSNADNGVEVTWTECEDAPGKGAFTNREYDYKKMVFKEDEIDKAFDLFKQKFLAARSGGKEEESSED